MNNFGLYVVNISKKLVDPVYSLDTIWERYELRYNGRTLFKTTLEDTAKYGITVKGNRLLFNDEVVAINNSSSAISRVESSNTISKFGNVVLQGRTCIKITKENYQKLRSGEHVDGYMRYGTGSVYYITDDVEHCPDIVYDPELIEGHEDIVYNSFIPGDLEEHSATEETMMSVETPTLAMRHFEATLVQGDTLDLEFFVDTYNYDSIYQGKVDDTFTIYITDENDNDLYYYEDEENHKHHHTVYAGQFKVKLNVGNTIGKHWFRICCVDNHGRGSIEYHYDYRIVSTTPNIKELTASDFGTGEGQYNLTPSNGTGITYAQGMNNKLEFVRMCHDLKSKGFDGVKFPNILNNNVYELDPRWNAGTNNNPAPATNKYYLLYYSSGTLYRYDSSLSTWVEVTGVNDVNPAYVEQGQESAVIDDSEIVLGKTFNINDEEVTCGSYVTFSFRISETQTVTFERSTPTVLDWIRYDGAGIYRDSSGKIKTPWGVLDPEIETFVALNNTAKTLQIRSLDAVIYAFNNNTSLSAVFPEDNGYYYCAYFSGGRKTRKNGSNTMYYNYGSYEDTLPSDFSIDLNGCTLKMVNNLAINDDYPRIINASGTSGLTVKNGTIYGNYNPENLVRAFLAGCEHATQKVWEGDPPIDACGTDYFTLDNLYVHGSYGYETRTSGVGNGALGVSSGSALRIKDTEFEGELSAYVRRINLSGNESTSVQDVIVYSDSKDKKSLITPIHPDYDVTKPNRNVCLITTDYCSLPYNSNGKMLLKYEQKSNMNPTWMAGDGNNHSFFSLECDEIYVGSYAKFSRGGVYPYFFIHFYTENDEYIKTVKTGMHVAIKLPVGAKKVRMTTYAICDVVTNGSNTTYDVLTITDQYNPNGAVKYVSDVYYVSSNVQKRLGLTKSKPSKNCTLRNCTYEDSRSCVIGNTGINYCVDGCTFLNICASPTKFSLTPMIVDIEEHFSLANIFCLKNCSAPKGTPRSGCDGSQRAITCGYLRFFQMENCSGFALNTGIGDGYIADNTFDASCVIHQDGAKGNGHYRFIFKRNIVKDGFAVIKDERNTTRVTCRSCFEPVPDVAVIEDCFVERPAYISSVDGVPVYYIGRSYKMFKYGAVDYIHDKYSSAVRQLWNISEEMDAREDGLVHFIVYADKPGARLRVGSIKDYFELNSSGKLLVYLNGVAKDGLFSDGYFIAPASGLHLITVKFNTKPFKKGSTMRVPDESIVAKFPSRVTSAFSISDKIPLDADGAGNRATIAFYSDVPIVLQSTDPFAPYITGNKLTRVFIPKGSRVNYIGFHYGSTYPWKDYTLHEEPLDLDKL